MKKSDKSMDCERVCIFRAECLDMDVVFGIALKENNFYDQETSIHPSSMYIHWLCHIVYVLVPLFSTQFIGEYRTSYDQYHPVLEPTYVAVFSYTPKLRQRHGVDVAPPPM